MRSARASENRKRNRRWGSRWISAAFVLLLAVFGYSAFKLTEGMLRAKEDRAAFAALSAMVAKSAPTPEASGLRGIPGTNNGAAEAPPSPTEGPSGHDAPDTGTDAAEASPLPPEEPPQQEAPDHQTPLPKYLTIYEMNPDFFGWLSIEGTNMDYPVMYTPDRPEYYLKRSFDGSFSHSGVPFVDEECPADGNYYLIYGHHMQNQTMFGQLPRYADPGYCEEHPVIRFDTLYEQREYRVVAAFYSRVYDKAETGVFRYYAYTDLSDEAVFREYMEQVYAAALYDTGIAVDYGDELLALSTCNYHTKNGRFVVVARRIDNAA